MPYLLLAAFYFVGFAMGVFNNSNGEETVEAQAAVTIQVEDLTDQAPEIAYYFQLHTTQVFAEAAILAPENAYKLWFEWSKKPIFARPSGVFSDSRYFQSHFNRPPPFVG